MQFNEAFATLHELLGQDWLAAADRVVKSADVIVFPQVAVFVFRPSDQSMCHSSACDLKRVRLGTCDSLFTASPSPGSRLTRLSKPSKNWGRATDVCRRRAQAVGRIGAAAPGRRAQSAAMVVVNRQYQAWLRARDRALMNGV
jgi:hypothetical protein